MAQIELENNLFNLFSVVDSKIKICSKLDYL